ncbi:MAG: ribosome biogenesis GTPase Der, partial [Smithellaceae bacterium]|nr:ribosome biogenesis GTPase Der [Smithellaceae bacterium]
VYAQYTKRIGTGELNRVVGDIIAQNPPPRQQGRANPFNYATQVSTAPPTFVFFVREPKAVHFSYERFLANQIREAFGFDQTPIRIFFKKKSK